MLLAPHDRFARGPAAAAPSLLCLILGLAACGSAVAADAERQLAPQVALRRPVAVVCDDDGRRVWVANSRSGSISLVDLPEQRVVWEARFGDQLSDLAGWADRNLLLAADAERHVVLLLRVQRDADGMATGLIEEARLDVAPWPVRLELDPAQQVLYVASLWSRRLSVISLDPAPTRVAEIELPMPPRAMCRLADGQTLLVADAFGGRLAEIDCRVPQLRRVRELHAHNIFQIAVDHASHHILLPHQQLHADEATTGEGVHWGGVMSNVIRTLLPDEIASDQWPPQRRLFYLGHPDLAAGDPAAILVTASGRQIVTLSGVAAVGISDPGANYFTSVAVGQRPTAMVLTPDQRQVVVVNTLSDTISVLDVETARQECEISLGPTPPEDDVVRGERLFYDARLSSDGWFSCHGCHTDGHTNGLRSDTLGDRNFGAPKRVLSLGGVGQTGPWAWDGQIALLETQIRKSIELTMRGPAPSEQQVTQLAAYLKTLQPPPGTNASGTAVEDPSTARGRTLFAELGCAGCHVPPTFTSADSYDVGLTDRLGHRTFNPPSLRGVSQRDRLFHENQIEGLRAVFTRAGHGLDRELSPPELEDLLAYLKSL